MAPAKKVPPRATPRPTSVGSSARATSKAAASKKAAPEKATAKKAELKKVPLRNIPVEKAQGEKAAAKKASQAGGKAEAMPGTAPPKVEVGSKAPAFELTDGDGKPIRSSALRGKPYVLYFYPKDNTPGCTTQACDFRDMHSTFGKLGVQVLGVSPDSEASHRGFASKFSLPFPLISDPEKELATAYGVYALKKNYGREFMGIVRSTFLVDAEGKVRAAWRGVRVPGHVEAVVAEIKKVGSL